MNFYYFFIIRAPLDLKTIAIRLCWTYGRSKSWPSFHNVNIIYACIYVHSYRGLFLVYFTYFCSFMVNCRYLCSWTFLNFRANNLGNKKLLLFLFFKLIVLVFLSEILPYYFILGNVNVGLIIIKLWINSASVIGP